MKHEILAAKKAFEAEYPISVVIPLQTANMIVIRNVDLSIQNHLRSEGVNDFHAFPDKDSLTYHFKSQQDLAVAEEKIYPEGSSWEKIEVSPIASRAELAL